jgi:predicted Zn-dependent protease
MEGVILLRGYKFEYMTIFRSVFLSTVFTFCLSFIHAQDYSRNYTPVSSTGQLPPIFVKTLTEKTNEDLSLLKDKNNSDLSKKKEFAIANNFNVDRILRGGSVLYNDSVSAYVHRVLNEILKKEPELRDHIQLYVIKSTQVNAFSFDNGVILVNTGLISQLDDESQLAFILCHELIHYKRRHSINAYLDFMTPSTNRYRKSRNDMDVLNYSKDQEIEADTAGLELFKATSYDLEAIHSSFDVLQYSYLPFDEQEFPRSFLEDGNLKFPKSYFLDKTSPIREDDNYDDSKSTHPNIRKRKTNVNSRIDNSWVNTNRKKFLVSQASFNQAKEISRFETCRLYLLNLDYPNAIYSAFILLKKYPQNVYLRKIVAEALYEVASYKTRISSADNTINVFSGNSQFEFKDYADIEGFSQQVYYLLKKLSSEEATVLALNYSWKLNASSGYKDKQLGRICDSLFVFLTQGNDKSLGDFSTRSRADILRDDSIHKVSSTKVTESHTENGETSKYDRIKAQQKKEEVIEIASNTEEDFGKYAFIALLKDSLFTSRFRHFSDIRSEKISNARHRLSYSERKRKNKQELKSGKALGIQKVVVVEPFYYHLDDNKAGRLDMEATASGMIGLQNVIQENAAKIHLEYQSIDPMVMKANDVATYNDFANINDWINERIQHGYNSRTLVAGAKDKDLVLAKYGTNYFMWTGVISLKRKGLRGTYTFIYIMVYDLANEKVVFSENREIRMRDSKATLNSNYYDIFNQIHQESNGDLNDSRNQQTGHL